MSERDFTVLADGKVWQGEVEVGAERALLSHDALREALGFDLKPEGLCKGALCVPVRDRSALVVDDRIDLAGLADLLDRPLALDLDAGAASLGESARDQTLRLETLEAPDFDLADVDGKRHRLSEYRGRKILLHAFASW